MGLFQDFRPIASGQFSTAGVITAGTRGFTCIRNGAGDYSITLDEALDVAEGIVLVQCQTTAIVRNVVHTSDTVKQILTTLAATGAATDSICDVLVFRTAP